MVSCESCKIYIRRSMWCHMIKLQPINMSIMLPMNVQNVHCTVIDILSLVLCTLPQYKLVSCMLIVKI